MTELAVTIIIFGIIGVSRILEPVIIAGGGNVGFQISSGGRYDLRLAAGVGRFHHATAIGSAGGISSGVISGVSSVRVSSGSPAQLRPILNSASSGTLRP